VESFQPVVGETKATTRTGKTAKTPKPRRRSV
jgi:hypothetical protein